MKKKIKTKYYLSTAICLTVFFASSHFCMADLTSYGYFETTPAPEISPAQPEANPEPDMTPPPPSGEDPNAGAPDMSTTQEGWSVIKDPSTGETYRVTDQGQIRVQVDPDGTIRQYGTDNVLDYMPGSGQGAPSSGSGTGGGTGGGGTGGGGGDGWNYVEGSRDYQKDDKGNFYFKADDGTYRDGAGDVYGGAINGGSAGQVLDYGIVFHDAQGQSVTSPVVDAQGNPVVQGENGYEVYKNGKYEPLGSEHMIDAATGKEMSIDAGGNPQFVERGADGKPYILGEDGKTKWSMDDKGVLSTTDERGNKWVDDGSGKLTASGADGKPLTLDAQGNVISSDGTNTGVRAPNMAGNIGNMIPRMGANGIMMGGVPVMSGGGGMMGGGGIGGAIGSLVGGLGSGVGGLFGGLMGGGGGMMSSSYGSLGGGYGGGMSSGYGSLGGGYGGGSMMGGSYGGVGGGGMNLPVGMGLPSGTIQGVLVSFLQWLLGIFGLIALISFLISGIMYFTAVGDKESAEKAKKQMQWSIIGVIVGLGGLIILQSITGLFSGSSMF